MAESTVFSPWSKTIIPFPLLRRKSRPTRMKTINRCQYGTKDMLCLTSLPDPRLSIDVPQGRPGPDGQTRGTDSTQ